MRKFVLASGLLVLALGLASVGFSDQSQDPRYGRGPGYGCDWGPGQGGGRGPMIGMGSDYGYGMHGGGSVMYERGHMMDPGLSWGHGPRDWQSMEPEQREKWQKMWSKYQMDTLEIRKQLATKKMELETLWDQPEVDQKKVEKLSNEVSELQAELGKKHDKYLLQCRQDFGDKGWSCPGGW